MLAPSSPSSPSSSADSPPAALSLARRAGHAFTPHAMVQGFVCHARGVELATIGAARVLARVRSKRAYDVLLRADGGRLVVACSCPARSFGLDVCKHAWAALLEIDRQEALSDLRKTRGPLVVEAAPQRPADGATGSDAREPAAVLDASMTPATRSKKRQKPAKTPRAAAESTSSSADTPAKSARTASARSTSARTASATAASARTASARTTSATAASARTASARRRPGRG